jgi:phosphoenolpyruvate synthase/pyruvate phosphate dikinase
MSFPPDCYVLGLQEIDQTQVAVVGGKGAQLGQLSRIEGIRVPAGFCVTTDAFRRVMADAPSIDDRLDRLSRLNPDDREVVRTLSAEIRRILERIPDDLAAAITGALAGLGEQAAYAVRSSATAEDLPTASFAGQQDTYLNVVGPVGDPPARQPVLGIAVHRASRDLPHAERLRSPEGPHGGTQEEAIEPERQEQISSSRS